MTLHPPHSVSSCHHVNWLMLVLVLVMINDPSQCVILPPCQLSHYYDDFDDDFDDFGDDGAGAMLIT